MTQPADLAWVVIVAGPDPIPVEWQQYIGREIGIPQEVLLQISTDPANPSKFRGVTGYRRANTSGRDEIVLVPPLPVAAQTFIRNLPAPLTWPNGEEAKLLEVARRLVFDYEVPPAAVRAAIQQVFDSTKLTYNTP
jgi:hypothetical protein